MKLTTLLTAILLIIATHKTSAQCAFTKASTESLSPCSAVGVCTTQSSDLPIYCYDTTARTSCEVMEPQVPGNDVWNITVTTHTGICLGNDEDGWECRTNPLLDEAQPTQTSAVVQTKNCPPVNPNNLAALPKLNWGFKILFSICGFVRYDI